VLHASVVQALPSSQVVVSVVSHVPVDVLHVSVVHASLSSHTTGVLWQPVTGSQVSVVQARWSSQSSGVPAWHFPATHCSMPSQTVPF
jgi:hypothetical protein